MNSLVLSSCVLARGLRRILVASLSFFLSSFLLSTRETSAYSWQNKDLVKEANYLSCKNCETKFHTKRFCSGFSRNDARTTARDNTLLCFMCARREWLECALCSSKFYSSQKGNKCCDCGNSYHYKCSKVLRSQQGSKDWKCPPAKESTSANPSNLEQATCATCAGLIKRGHNRNKCAVCSNEGHIKCSGGRRFRQLLCFPPALPARLTTVPEKRCPSSSKETFEPILVPFVVVTVELTGG